MEGKNAGRWALLMGWQTHPDQHHLVKLTLKTEQRYGSASQPSDSHGQFQEFLPHVAAP